MEKAEVELLIQQKNEPQNLALSRIEINTMHIAKNNELEHKTIYRKIDNLIESSVALSQQNSKRWEDLSKEVINLKIQNASYYGKVAIISGLLAVGATLFLTKIWGLIIDFLYKSR